MTLSGCQSVGLPVLIRSIGRCEYLECVGNIGGDGEALATLAFDFRCQLAERVVAGEQRRR